MLVETPWFKCAGLSNKIPIMWVFSLERKPENDSWLLSCRDDKEGTNSSFIRISCSEEDETDAVLK